MADKKMIHRSFDEWFDVHSEDFGIDLPIPVPLKQQPAARQNEWKEWIEKYCKKVISKEELRRHLERMLDEMGVLEEGEES